MHVYVTPEDITIYNDPERTWKVLGWTKDEWMNDPGKVVPEIALAIDFMHHQPEALATLFGARILKNAMERNATTRNDAGSEGL